MLANIVTFLFAVYLVPAEQELDNQACAQGMCSVLLVVPRKALEVGPLRKGIDGVLRRGHQPRPAGHASSCWTSSVGYRIASADVEDRGQKTGTGVGPRVLHPVSVASQRCVVGLQCEQPSHPRRTNKRAVEGRLAEQFQKLSRNQQHRARVATRGLKTKPCWRQ